MSFIIAVVDVRAEAAEASQAASRATVAAESHASMHTALIAEVRQLATDRYVVQRYFTRCRNFVFVCVVVFTADSHVLI
jgi:hypothetical protein